MKSSKEKKLFLDHLIKTFLFDFVKDNLLYIFK